MKLRSDRKNLNNPHPDNALDLSIDVDDQFLKDNLNTMEKMHQLRAQLELKKRDKDSKVVNKFSRKSMMNSGNDGNGISVLPTNSIHMKLNGDIAVDDGAIGGTGIDGSTIDKLETNTTKTRRYGRRIYLPPLKGFIENTTSLQKNYRTATDRTALVDTCSGGDGDDNIGIVTNHGNKHHESISFNNSHLIEPSTSPVIRADETIWQSKMLNDHKTLTDTPKSKRKLIKSNWIQSLIEIMKTSKVPLSPGELIEIKESFKNIKESANKDTPHSPQMDKRIETKASPFESMFSDFSKATMITSESYRSRIRDNIRRNRSFKAVGSNGLIIEENRVRTISVILQQKKVQNV